MSLHILVLFPFHWTFDVAAPTAQIYLQASLQPQPPKSVAPPPPRQKVPGLDLEKLTTGTKRPATVPERPQPEAPQQGSVASVAPEPELASRQAMILDQAVPPEYPAEALQRKLEGCVLAAVTVSTEGEVLDVQILQSDHTGVFDQSVIDAQKAARYFPAQKDGRAIESRVLAVSAFVLGSDRKMNCALRFARTAETMTGPRE